MNGPAVLFTRATLSAGTTSTEYLRAGRGDAVLLLISGGGESALSLQLIGALSQRCRIIAPTGLAPDGTFAASLHDFLEGLGVAATAIVAEGRFCAAALEYVADAATGINRLALLVTSDDARTAGAVGAADVKRIRGAAAQRLRDSPAALFVQAVSADAGSSELNVVAGALLRFLA